MSEDTKPFCGLALKLGGTASKVAKQSECYVFARGATLLYRASPAFVKLLQLQVLAMARPWQQNLLAHKLPEKLQAEGLGMVLNLQVTHRTSVVWCLKLCTVCPEPLAIVSPCGHIVSSIRHDVVAILSSVKRSLHTNAGSPTAYMNPLLYESSSPCE